LAITAKIRYNAPDQPGLLTLESGQEGAVIRVGFEEPVRAVTPGQSLVCYQGEEVVAGGIIA
jgi:tRNA-specific 2-thiouridylase